MTNHEVWDKTIELNGVSIQSVVCMEECSELIKAISKRLRGELDIENNLAEEMADVTISLYQLTRMYDIDDADVHAWIDRKTERQRKRNALQDHQSGETTRRARHPPNGSSGISPTASRPCGRRPRNDTADSHSRLAHKAEWKREYRRKRKENNERQ